MSTDVKQSAGYFKEKAIVGLSRVTGDDLNRAIFKTTSHMLKAPKEKYMQYLLAATYGHCRKPEKNGRPICEYIVRELEKRSHTHNWVIVLKSMVVFHRLLTDGSDEVVRYICLYQHIFSFNRIKELRTSMDGAEQNEFIFQYVAYLNSRCSMQKELGDYRRVETKEFEEYYQSLNVNTLYPVFQSLLQGLNALASIVFREYIINNFCTYEAHQLLIRDGKNLFQLLSKSVIFILGGFTEFSIPQKRSWIVNYRLYDEVARKLKIFFDSMLNSSKVFTEAIPRLKPLPESLLARLEDDLEKYDTPNEVVSLESLGISSSSATKTEQKPAPVPEKVSAPSPPVAKPAAPPAKPPQPTFTMDDLFDSTPVVVTTANQQQQQFQQFEKVAAEVTPYSPNSDNWGSAETAWGTGAPTEWSTGAPQQPIAQAPVHVNLSNHVTPSQPPAQPKRMKTRSRVC
ncbi:clathrin coat assembly protein [Angomonas deanei]|uniref:ANTH domain/ENTH domain containing protein, putative n=1 Tax=Angomonas deanei TaxID=59799 RepID=A0A7G2CJL7_9TRYP|nr:clathrin coat assembly protein [Angomonas deanei]CAD2219986.1 ANTH domain/ENTH domain containing protein, putative [Angomonas deanei]|eukprot:EPY38528.1 clathrin coat assembly protein [Angomonas deanei]